jgi:TonB-linked SusC/RagA family outer membrane protein
MKTVFYAYQKLLFLSEFSMIKRILILLSFLVLLIIIPIDLMAQHVLRGKVIGQNNQPLPSASIQIKGVTGGSTSDLNGAFLIEVPNSKSIITISHQGYFTLEVEIGNDREKVFQLDFDEAASRLDEVVVVGFGTQKKVTVTGSMTSVSVKALEQSSAPSLSNALAGRMPGIITRQTSGEPGYDQAQVFIRGLGTWGSRAPLVLVDGVERNMNNINTQEIESFSVLKDASATAVYGVRGANGVILITTKKGVEGKPKVMLRSETAMLSALRVPEYIDGIDYLNLWDEAYRNMGQDEFFGQEEIEKYKTGDPYLYPNVDWTSTIMKKDTYQTINNLSMNGGTDIIRYYANVGYTEQSGLWKSDSENPYNTNINMKRYNLRSNIDVNVTKNLLFEFGLGGVIQQGNYPARSAVDIFDALRKTPPIAFPVTNPDGTPAGVTQFLGSNPWGMVTQSGYLVQARNSVQGTFATKWDLSEVLLQGLSLNGRFAYDHNYSSDVRRQKNFEVKQYLGKDLVTNEDMYSAILREATPLGYTSGNGANRAYYSEFILNYSRSFGSHDVSGMMMYNQRDYTDLTAGTSINNLPFRRQGVASRLTYAYLNRYLLEFNAGYNGSENFPREKRFGFFPSVSAGWVLSNEKFWGTDNAINHLKLRGSYGKVGNDEIGGRRFLYLTYMNAQDAQSYRFGDNMQSMAGIDEAQTGNPDVSWEVSQKSNLGLDLEMFNGKVVMQVDAFWEDRNEILLQRQQIPFVTGIYPWVIPYANLGKVNNKGIDGMLEIKNRTASGLYYSGRVNVTYAKNIIIENDEPNQRYPWLSAKGQPIDQPFGWVAEGIFKDQEEINNSPEQRLGRPVQPGDIKYRDLNDDNIIDDNDRKAIGLPRTPRVVYGFGGTVAYKGFDLSLFFTGAAQTSIYLYGATMYPFQDGVGTFNVQTEYYDNRWTTENPNGKYPAAITVANPNNNRASTLWQVDGSYLRLKNAEFAYTFEQGKLSRIGMNSLRLFANAVNLHTWDKVKIMDPESDSGTNFYPLQRTLNFGLQVNFK